MADALSIYAAHPLWCWIALAAALLAVEIATGSGWLLWPSASAAAVGLLVKALPMPLAGALTAFALLTIASTLLARRFLPRTVAQGDINDGVGRLLGMKGRVVADFAAGNGRVFVDGKEWAAEIADGGSLAAGDAVLVTGVSGAKLQVRGA